jgi:quercetin dioxygenase-like cupin family protein
MNTFTNYRRHVGARPDKFYKTTLFESARLMVGLNCLELGQAQHAHEHADQDKFYFVIEGQGEFVVGDETHVAGAGGVVFAPAGVPHGVTNAGQARLVVLMGIAPWR